MGHARRHSAPSVGPDEQQRQPGFGEYGIGTDRREGSAHGTSSRPDGALAAAALERRHARRATVWLSMQPADLGGIPGAGAARSRRRDVKQLDCRGTFAFRAEHEGAIAALVRSGRPVMYRGAVDGEHRSLEVRVLSVVPMAGIAFFEGSGEPT